MTKGPEPAKLAREAFAVADRYHEGTLTREQTMAKLTERCPVYSQAGYRRALGQGLLESR